MTRHSVQADMLELVTDTHRADPDQLTIGDALADTRMCPECGILAAAPGDRYCEPCRDGIEAGR